ncbi:MAG: hypothetical protein EOM26_07440 [Alphaproteobacteria bacterium]|nr:hypothetical protein [Alphaproteobacteria bacterium]
MREGISTEKGDLEKGKRDDPAGWRAADVGKHHLSEHWLNGKDQAGGKKKQNCENNRLAHR